MGLFAAGQVVVIPFPYTDLTGRKLRPALLLASAGHDDWVICQITSNPFADSLAIPITQSNFAVGGLRHTSYVRPSKLFTAHESLIVLTAGSLNPAVLKSVRDAVIKAIQQN